MAQFKHDEKHICLSLTAAHLFLFSLQWNDLHCDASAVLNQNCCLSLFLWQLTEFLILGLLFGQKETFENITLGFGNFAALHNFLEI